MTTPTTASGTVQNVYEETLGDELVADAEGPFGKLPGTSTLYVDDAVDFEPTGGTLALNGSVLAYTAADLETGAITLAAPLTSGAVIGDRVDVWDPAVGGPAVEVRAHVELPEDVDNDEPLEATVAHSLVPLLPLGLRDPGTGESVRLTYQAGEWTVTDVVASTPRIDGTLIVPGTVDGGAITPGTLPEEALGFTMAAGGTTVTLGSAPATPAVGDLWLDAAAGYVVKVWDGSAWTAHQFGTAAIANGAISQALVSFNARDLGGVTTSIGATAPSTPLTGDLWYDSSHGYQLNRYTGTGWTLVQYGTDAIAAGAITAAQIAAGTITAAQLAAGTITADRIATGTITGDRIAGGTITGNLVAANAIAAGHIQAGAIDTTKISFSARAIGAVITSIGTVAPASPIAGDVWYSIDAQGGIQPFRWDGAAWVGIAFNAAALSAGSITADKIAAGSISADKLGVGALDAQSITAASIFAGNFTGTIQGTATEPTSIIGASLSDCTVEMDAASGPLLVHGSAGAPTVTTYTASGSFTPPAGVTSVKVEAWGAGGSGQPGFAGQGGGGGEYARNDNVPVTPGTVYNFTVAGTAVANIGFANGTDGGNTTFTGNGGVVVKANGGKGGYSSVAGAGAGGSGSTAPVHFNGGTAPDSSASAIWSGQGGGSSGGSSRAGNAGKEPANNSYTGGAGGAAVTDGGAGGKGGDGTDGTTTHPGSAGTAGAVPGGGGGGGSYDRNYATLNGGNGARGQLRITYTVAVPPLLASISPVAGTDQYGNTYPAGIHDAVIATVQTVAIGTPLNGAGLGSPYAPPTLYFVKDSNDVVTFWGYGWVNAALTANTAYNVANLPAGYRPAFNFTFPSVSSMSGQLTGRVQIYANGQVTWVPAASSTATGATVSITGSYKAGN